MNIELIIQSLQNRNKEIQEIKPYEGCKILCEKTAFRFLAFIKDNEILRKRFLFLAKYRENTSSSEETRKLVESITKTYKDICQVPLF